MKCAHCNKEIYGLTGLQEIQKYQKHLRSCKKNPHRQVFVNDNGSMTIKSQDLMEALEERAKSGQ